MHRLIAEVCFMIWSYNKIWFSLQVGLPSYKVSIAREIVLGMEEVIKEKMPVDHDGCIQFEDYLPHLVYLLRWLSWPYLYIALPSYIMRNESTTNNASFYFSGWRWLLMTKRKWFLNWCNFILPIWRTCRGWPGRSSGSGPWSSSGRSGTRWSPSDLVTSQPGTRRNMDENNSTNWSDVNACT